MGSAASALDRTSPESLAALAESSGKPPIVASLVRQHFIDADTAILHLNEEALKEALATTSEKSSPLACTDKKCVAAIERHAAPITQSELQSK